MLFLAATAATVLATSCDALRFRPLEHALSRMKGEGRWVSVEPLRRSTDDFNKARDDDLLLFRYQAQFSPQPLDRETPCPQLERLAGAPGAPVFILVHGVYGDGREWWPVVPLLAQAKPAGVFMFRWGVAGQHGELVDALTVGVNRIAACFPSDTPLVLLAHSAGGVMASFAAHGFQVGSSPTQPRLRLLTVASPLAGSGFRDGPKDVSNGESDTRLTYEIGGTIPGYPAAADGVEVIHFRTQFPADTVMRPQYDHSPNQRGVGVAGAREVDLPADLGHEAALLHVVQELVAGRAP